MQEKLDIKPQEQFPKFHMKNDNVSVPNRKHTDPNTISESDTETEMEVKGWTKPHISVKMKKMHTSQVDTQNRYAPLQDNEDAKPEQLTSRTNKPPPLYTYGVKNQFQFTRSLSTTCQLQPTITHGKDYIRF